MTWLIALLDHDERSLGRLPNRCVHSTLHSEKTSYLFADCIVLDLTQRHRIMERVYYHVAMKVFFYIIETLNKLFYFSHNDKLYVLIGHFVLF